MNRNLGLTLMFLGGYIVLLGGMFWNMTAPDPNIPTEFKPVNVYDWVWGLSAAIVICIGAAIAIKKNLFLGLLGCGIGLAGAIYSIAIVIVGKLEENYFSGWILAGAIVTLFGVVIAVLTHIAQYKRFKKYGPTLM